MVGMPDDWELVTSRLRESGVSGVDDFGRFVNNTKYFEPSRFDEVAAAPVLAAILPEISDPRVAATIGRHLQNKRVGKQHYDAILEAFKRWATHPGETGWVLGDTLARMADKARADEFVELARQGEYRSSRAFVVDALWRFKSVVDVEPILTELIRDPDVSLYAMTALQRTIGAPAMAERLRVLINTCDDELILSNARRQLKRVEKKLTR